jgi:hypothetical protein
MEKETGQEMNPQDLAHAHENKLRNYCCKKCGGRLTQVYDQTLNKYIVICGPNKCYPLEVETMHARTLREAQQTCDAIDVQENYSDLFPRKEVGKPRNLFQE